MPNDSETTLLQSKEKDAEVDRRILDEDSGDDFQPTKAVAKSAPKKPAPSRPLTSLKAEEKKYSFNSDEEGIEVIDVSKKTSSAKPGTSAILKSKSTLKSANQKLEVDSDVDFDVLPSTSEKGKQKVAPKRKT